MKKITGIIAVLLLIFLTACTQVTFVNPDDIFPGWEENQNDKNQNQDDAAALISYLQSESFMEKIAGNSTSTLKIEKGEGSSDAGKASRASNDGYPLTVEFIGFTDSAENISIESGIIRIVFNGISKSDDAVTITSVDLSTIKPLEYSLSSRNGTFEMNYTGGTATGTIDVSGDSFSFLSTPTVSAPSAGIRIKVNGSTVRWNNDFGAEITNGFGGGAGTEQDPYRIYNEEQFIHISDMVPNMIASADGFYYFDVLDDLKFTDDMDSPLIPFFRGDLDFNGHKLEGITKTLTGNMSEVQKMYVTDSRYNNVDIEHGLITNFLEGTIRNLEYYPADSISLLAIYGNWPVQEIINNKAQNVGSSIAFNNVNVYGDFSDEQTSGTNMSFYMAIPYMSTLTFEDCENHASFNVNYGGAFLGGYLGVVNGGAIPCYVVFRNCTNYGNISGNQVGVLIGSHNNISVLQKVTDIRVTAENCHNEGIITGAKGAGFYGPATEGRPDMTEYAWFDSSTMSTNTGDDPEHIIVQAEPTGVGVSLGDNYEIIVQINNPDYASYKIEGSTYSRIIEADGSDGGTWIVYRNATDVPASQTASGLRKLKIIDSTNPAITEEALAAMTEDANGYEIITINGTDYYYHDSLADNGKTRYIVGYPSALETDLTWNLTCYDAEGYMLGTKQLSF